MATKPSYTRCPELGIHELAENPRAPTQLANFHIQYYVAEYLKKLLIVPEGYSVGIDHVEADTEAETITFAYSVTPLPPHPEGCSDVEFKRW